MCRVSADRVLPREGVGELGVRLHVLPERGWLLVLLPQVCLPVPNGTPHHLQHLPRLLCGLLQAQIFSASIHLLRWFPVLALGMPLMDHPGDQLLVGQAR